MIRALMVEAVDSAQAPALGTVVRGGYQLLRFLGAGAMGAVYEAQTLEGKRVAVKVLLRAAIEAGGGQMVQRFKREANVTATLDSPHVGSCSPRSGRCTRWWPCGSSGRYATR
jgi:serine/threonine protein kinase